MGRNIAYWYRRGRGVLVGEGGVAIVTASSELVPSLPSGFVDYAQVTASSKSEGSR